MRKMTATCAAIMTAAAFTAHADDQVFVGGPAGAVYVADSDTGEFTYFACFCIGPIVSIQPLGSDMLVADSFGGLWQLDGQSGEFVDGAWTGLQLSDMAIDGENAIMVTTDGQLLSAPISSGFPITTIETPVAVTSVLLFDGKTYIGGEDGSIHRSDSGEAQWSSFGQLTSAIKTLSARPEALIAADDQGQASIIDWAGAPDDSYYVTTDTVDAGYTGTLNLFTQAPGAVHVFDADTLLQVDTWTLPVEASAIFVRPGSVCKADTNRNGVLEAGDLTAWIAAFNRGDFIADQNNDLNITPTDFTAWISNFNEGCD